MGGRNVLVFMSDEHARGALGCYGHPLVKTPNLDRLAGQGMRFDRAYTPSPVCVPARAAFATGRHVFDTRCWSNAQPYHGETPGWGHRLIEDGREVVSIGKLHYRDRADKNGFSREILPLHVRGGQGFIQGLLRREHHVFADTAHFVEEIGPGGDPYTSFDEAVSAEAVRWLETEGRAKRDKPWVLFVSFVRPHYPLTCPEAFYDLYPPEAVGLPRFAGRDKEFAHPVLSAFRTYYDYDDHFDTETRQIARASYFGLCSFVDDLVGQVLTALEETGQDQDTAVLYTSDHGEMNGDHGLWTKMVMYEEAVGIPMILAGAGVPQGSCATNVSLIDAYQTILEAAGVSSSAEDESLPGRSLYDIAAGAEPERDAFSEYHDGGAITGFFMLRHDHWKYIYYPNFAPQLFDIENDPLEENDLGSSLEHAEVRARCHARMQAIGDPDALNRQAFDDQARRIAELGGVEAVRATPAFDFTPVDEVIAEAGLA